MSTNANLSTTNHWLRKSTRLLEEADIATARIDALVLLEDATHKDRSWLLAHPDEHLATDDIEKLDKLILRRSHHEPLSYIRGKSEFYGREFIVNAHTLEPRPETETMIDLLKNTAVDSEIIIDVGTGSGCIAITAKLELPKSEVIGIDIDKKCLETAKLNAKKLNADVAFYQGDLLQTMPSSTSRMPSSKLTIVANLPYVPDTHTINRAAMFEPKHAIFGGKDGLDLYRVLFGQIKKLKPEYVLTESLPPQHNELSAIAKTAGYNQLTSDDFIQMFKANSR